MKPVFQNVTSAILALLARRWLVHVVQTRVPRGQVTKVAESDRRNLLHAHNHFNAAEAPRTHASK